MVKLNLGDAVYEAERMALTLLVVQVDVQRIQAVVVVVALVVVVDIS